MKTAGALTSSGFGEIQVAYCSCQAALIRSVANGDRTVMVFFFFEAFYTFFRVYEKHKPNGSAFVTIWAIICCVGSFLPRGQTGKKTNRKESNRMNSTSY